MLLGLYQLQQGDDQQDHRARLGRGLPGAGQQLGLGGGG